MKNLPLILFLLISTSSVAQVNTMVTFETLKLSTPDTFWNGSDSSGSFRIQDITFENEYNHDWKFWSGFVYSNVQDTVTPGIPNQYAAFAGSGVNYSDNYALVGTDGVMNFDKPRRVHGCYVTNSTFAVLSMRKGDQYAKVFGGTDGNDKDYFRIIAEGYNSSGQKTDTFYLADFRFDDNSKDYIVTDWDYFDLSRLGEIVALTFRFESSDTGQYGINTPMYFCMDNFDARKPDDRFPEREVPHQEFERLVMLDSALDGRDHEGGFYLRGAYFVNDFNADWNTWSGWSISTMSDTSNGSFINDKSAIVGSGFGDSRGYLTGYNRATIYLDYTPKKFEKRRPYDFTCRVTNSTYAYKTMQNGNQFAKKFGGDSGSDPDYLVLKVSGVDYEGNQLDTVTHYLADFRYNDNTMDYISKSWRLVDLSPLLENKSTVRLDFWVEGSDTGQYGLNTPGYFCLDNLFEGRDAGVYQPALSELSVYPNPTNGVLNVRSNSPLTSVIVLDLTGKVVMQKTNTNVIDLNTLKPGIYMVGFSTETKTIFKRIVKE